MAFCEVWGSCCSICGRVTGSARPDARSADPRGQIIWADALYLKSIPALAAVSRSLDPAARKSKILKSMAVALLYGYCDYAMEIARASGIALSDDERSTIDAQLREAGEREFARAEFPGRRPLAAVLHRLWRMIRPRDDGWSVSNAHLGNLTLSARLQPRVSLEAALKSRASAYTSVSSSAASLPVATISPAISTWSASGSGGGMVRPLGARLNTSWRTRSSRGTKNPLASRTTP